MKWLRGNLISTCMAAIALIALQAASAAAAEPKASSHSRPIVDTHIHFYQVTRPGGVPWPPVGSELYRDVLPSEYKPLAIANGIVASGVVEASPLVEDNQWILDLLGHDAFFPFFVGQLEIGSANFIADLNRFSRDHRFVGIRGFLWRLRSMPCSLGICVNSRAAA
jgi:L-fuconolactonase